MNKDIFGKYNLVLGLEIHVEPTTARKMFCRCDANIFEAEPNTHTCPTCLGLPGALPVPNPEAIRKIQLMGKIFGCDLSKESKFDRKHYFYPDLPKGYQISQYKQPFCVGGSVKLSNGKTAVLERIHLEEDTAKSTHTGDKTLIDFNMCSMPLIELVTTPAFESVEDAVEFSKYVQKVVREFGIGDADMEKGQMRLEPNISLRTDEQKEAGELPPYKVEIKNINSFKFMERAVMAEVKRQRELLDNGETPLQENRGYNENTKKTVSQRSKEDAKDYRYFPEPDIPPFVFDDEYMAGIDAEFEQLLKQTPTFKKNAILDEFEISEDLQTSANEILDLEHIEKISILVDGGVDARKAINKLLNDKEAREKTANDLKLMFEEKSDKVSDISALATIVEAVVAANQDAVESYKSGKENALQFLVGMIMRESKGKADIKVAKEILLKKL